MTESIPLEPIVLRGDPDAPPETLRDPTVGQGGSILSRWGVSVDELTRLVDENPSLRGIMLGYVAEHKFRELIEAHQHVASSRKYDDHNRDRKSDRVIVYRGTEFSVEVKSLQSNSIRKTEQGWQGRAQVDGSDRRMVTFADGTQLNTTLLRRGDFDVLAVNCFAFDQTWRFAFALNRDLPPSRYRGYSEAQRAQLIASLIPVSWPPVPPFVEDPFDLLKRLHSERTAPRAR